MAAIRTALELAGRPAWQPPVLAAPLAWPASHSSAGRAHSETGSRRASRLFGRPGRSQSALLLARQPAGSSKTISERANWAQLPLWPKRTGFSRSLTATAAISFVWKVAAAAGAWRPPVAFRIIWEGGWREGERESESDWRATPSSRCH